MPYLRVAVIFIFACLVNSCGLVNTAYNNAPELIGWWLDGYFEFTKSQKAQLKLALHDIHDWHRKQQLPEYVNILSELQSVVSKDNIKPSEACEKIEQIKSSVTTLQLAFVPAITTMAGTLSDRQLAYLSQKLSERADKWKSEWWQDTPEAQVKARLEKIEDYAEKVFGRLSKTQRARIKHQLENSDIQPSITYAEILRRNEDIVQIITAIRNPTLSQDDKYALVSAGFERLQLSPNLVYQAYAKQVNQRTCEIIADLQQSTDHTQKAHAVAWLGKYISQFSNLALVNKSH
jgi:Spy/CpxP family protein refolding chaperone